MKVTLVMPPYPFGWDSPPLGIMYIASVLREVNHSVKIICFNKNKEDFLTAVKESDFLGISLTSQIVREGEKIIQQAKKISPQVKVVVGGPHVTIFEKKIFEQFPLVDYACVGEAEYTMLELAEGKGLGQIRGLIWKDKKGQVIANPPRELIKDLDLLPFPARDLVNLKKFEEAGIIMTSRGCPFRCVYCYKLSGNIYRTHSAERVILEMERMRFEYGIRNFVFADDNFVADPNRANIIAEMIIKKQWRDITLDFSNGIRVDSIVAHPELIAKFTKIGLKSVSLGVESVVQDVLDASKKDITLEKVVKAIRILKRNKIDHFVFLQVGLPNDNYQNVEATKKWLLKNGITNFGAALTTPYPKTELWNYVEKKGRFLFPKEEIYKHYPWHNMTNVYPIWETDSYKAEERMRALAEIRYFAARMLVKNDKKKVMLLLRNPGLLGWIIKYIHFSILGRFLQIIKKIFKTDK
ncbi:hypothetical protein COX24_01415 [bacterium (Candidatus Gribaldobacteria) CG23_combo_of_CG06-09_8_20_14_all_37_87_8]|uniref:Uncharacterized protein n=2 Tax=Bacteria candidate phyla TaxID=1783234 RepID=A0A2H0TLW1_9BACT|nr:MAG: hypothetical protein COX24_01415 [bacterium (Candidatus Gribaldobacteria) CG23_combo_of_CG06-09_8_20_14_all_37_87_8]PIR73138.1 MAG: hypothetical protein COV26_00100 [Candidatus Nealsonbacteria bacterium CG10_big_fil_rev_8_21_14_0_10_36_23]